MSKLMLIDASHPEESRVAILHNKQLDEFDFETTTKKQLKGNIYLAKIIRIEPSLQAAFVEFGSNRHGFLAFNEIHPDYYRIPIEDREALLAQVAEEIDLAGDEPIEGKDKEKEKNSEVEILGGEDVEEIEVRPQRNRPSRQYKIQEVIKRRQIMLVQVTKEERGGKGAALTTYLSLAGRYCVLMPNAAKGGGISRKITNAADRKRLKEVIGSIDLPKSMSLIIRTAGMSRTKTEIKRDSDYLMELWNEIREKTLHSIAPALIYEESDLIKRAIRDYYTREIDEIWVDGENGYKEAKTFIRKLMPSHTKKVKQYMDEKVPLFNKYSVDKQIDSMHSPNVQLKSGGYIVFGTTEALVAIDVNSGKATRERHIEETAFKTNMEAAEEVARQLRLRDLAGLVVIDFIDMEETRNIEAVERRLKDAMRHDRARVQVGRISAFGLLELSRQRLRPNIIESTSLPCQACRGTGMVRSVESSSLHVLRGIEDEAIEQKANEISVFIPTAIAMYMLNQKKKSIEQIESKWNIGIRFNRDDSLIPPDFRIERVSLKRPHSPFETTDKEMTEKANKPERKQQHHKGQKSPATAKQAHEKRAFPKDIVVEPSLQETVQSPVKQEKSPGEKSRRRYRKYDRRQRQTTKGETSTSKSQPNPPQPNQEKPSQKTESKESNASSHPPSPQRKKAASRKGWWQRLLE